MTTPETHPYDWLKTVESHLIDRSGISSKHAPHEFSWEALSHQLAHHFQLEDLSLHDPQWQWRSDTTVNTGLAEPLVSLHYAVGQLPGHATVLLAKNDLSALMSVLLTGEARPLPHADPAFEKGFVQYLAQDLAFLLQKAGFTGVIAPRFLSEGAPSPRIEEEALCLDILLTLQDHTFTIRLALSEPLAKAWKEHFVHLQRHLEIPPALAQKIDLTLALEAGRVVLTQQEWSAVKTGDFLLLDSCSIVPGVDKGRVLLTLDGFPLFRAMLKADKIKILEIPEYLEVETPMGNDTHNGDEEELANLDDELDDDTYEDEEEEGEEEAEEEAAEEEEPAQEDVSEESATAAPAEQKAATKEPLNPVDRVPLNIAIEVGRLKMSLAKLRELEPGQILELDVKPEEGVDLVVNGRCIGRGELLRVGESLGVRLLELG